MGTLLIRPPGHRRDVSLRPAATAMVWIGDGQRHEMIAVPGVSLADDDVLVAVEMSTICDTDVESIQRGARASAPRILGHESVGRVIAIGDTGATSVDGTALRIGDRIVWSTTIDCGACDRCESNSDQRCLATVAYGEERIGVHGELTGAFGTHIQLRRGTAIVRVPETLPAAVLAPASCAVASAWAALARVGRDLEGRAVRIHGATLVGLAAAAIAVEHGATVEIIETDAARRPWARRFGATTLDRAPDIVLATSAESMVAAIDAVAPGGTVVVCAGSTAADPAAIHPDEIARRRLTIVGAHGSSPRDLVETIAFLSGRGRAYPFADVVSAVRPLCDVDDALAAASAPESPLRIGLVPG